MDILIKGLALLPEGYAYEVYIRGNGDVIDKASNSRIATAIELPSHEGTDIELYDYLKQGSYFIKLNTIASELSFLIHCEKEKKIKDVLGRLVAMRNAIWDSVTLEASNGSDN